MSEKEKKKRVRRERVRAVGGSYSVPEFAEAEGVSRAMIYILWNRGEGPRYYTVGNRRRITQEARQEWHREREVSQQREAS